MNILDHLKHEAAQLQADLTALHGAIEVLERRHTPATALALPSPAKPDVPTAQAAADVAPGAAVAPLGPVATSTLPDGVSAHSSLEPDYTINGVPLYLTDTERLLFDTLMDAADDEFVPLDRCIAGSGLVRPQQVYALLAKLRSKLKPTGSNIENSHGAGYRLVLAA